MALEDSTKEGGGFRPRYPFCWTGNRQEGKKYNEELELGPGEGGKRGPYVQGQRNISHQNVQRRP